MKHGDLCPCGSYLTYAICCAPYHDHNSAPTAEALMRSRYCAYVLGNTKYLLDTWHPSTRPALLTMDNDECTWCGLELIHVSGGQETEQYGEVEFIARWFSKDGRCGSIHERSRFIREEGRWSYVDGKLFPGVTVKTGRNEPCPCGSGRKFKQCCGR